MNTIKDLLEQLGMGSLHNLSALCDKGCVCEDCMMKHSNNGCGYGNPTGLDDWNECCECEDNE
jgi:hypothetical protein